MRSQTRTILAGALGYLVGFGTDLVSYLTGIRDQGGTWSDVDGISIATIVVSGLVSAGGALMLLLAKPPETGTLVTTRSDRTITYPKFTTEKTGNPLPKTIGK